MTTDAIREAMTTGTITTLGQLRPGDVGAFVHDNGIETPRFAFLKIVERPGWGRVAVAQFEGGGYIDEPWLARPVRFLGRGRIEPAKIVMDGESDPTIEQTVRRVLAAAVSDGIVTYDRDPTRLTAGELVGAANVLNDAMGELLRRIAELEEQVRTLREALNMYRSAFGQALEPHGIPLGPQQRLADEISEAALAATAPKEKP